MLQELDAFTSRASALVDRSRRTGIWILCHRRARKCRASTPSALAEAVTLRAADLHSYPFSFLAAVVVQLIAPFRAHRRFLRPRMGAPPGVKGNVERSHPRSWYESHTWRRSADRRGRAGPVRSKTCLSKLRRHVLVHRSDAHAAAIACCHASIILPGLVI